MSKLRFFIVMLVFIAGPTLAQEIHSSQSLIRLLYPTDNDSVSYSRIRIAGSTLPSARVRINGDSSHVYPSGAFVGRVSLSPGVNTITITAEDSIRTEEKLITIYRIPPLPVSPIKPVEIDTRIMWPDQDIMLLSGDFLEVRFKGSPGRQAKFSIDDLCKNIPMTELDPKDAAGMKGIYSGVVRLETDKIVVNKPVKFELRGKHGGKAKMKSRAKVTVRANKIPVIGETIDTAYLKNSPYGLGVMSILPAGVRLNIVGFRGNHYKVLLAQGIYAYVRNEKAKILLPGTPIPRTSISLPSIRYQGDWILLTMRTQTACPFQVRQTVDPATLELTVYGAHLLSQWITYPDFESTIKMVRWAQPSADVFKLWVDLNQKQQWGYRVITEPGRLVLKIRRAPRIAEPPASPVAGLTFALDAGHGGEEKGAVGPTGLMEKDVNLRYTEKLAALLDSAGAKVVITRKVDTTMTLAKRIEIAREENAHFFCWLHNNSIGSTSNPTAVRGTSTYFTIPQNQDLAWTIYPRLLKIGLKPFGRVQSDYYVTRRTDMLIVLVEGAFMSHPQDEMLLMNDAFLDKLARAVFNGLEDFCRKQIPTSAD